VKKLLLMFVVGLVSLGLTAAEVVSAHTGQASITCTSVTFSYASFPGNGDNTVSESVTVDGASVYADTFTFQGSSGGHTIGVAVPQDGQEHLVEVEASWSTNGHSGSFSDSARLVCGEAPPPPTEEPPPPGPPYTCPDGLPPDGGKDGEPGNDDCDHTQPPSNTAPPAATPPPPETSSSFEPPPPVETTPPTAETSEAPAIVGKPPVSEDKPAPKAAKKAQKKAQKKAKGKSIAAKPDTAPQAAPFTL
jgi:hypothetical protein